MLKLIHVVGARPNFMKAAPVYFALRDHPDVRQLLVHTGQHYDRKMSDVFFEELGIQASLQNEVGTVRGRFSVLVSPQEMLAEGAAAQPVNRAHFFDELFTLLLKSREGGGHGQVISMEI